MSEKIAKYNQNSRNKAKNKKFKNQLFGMFLNICFTACFCLETLIYIAYELQILKI